MHAPPKWSEHWPNAGSRGRMRRIVLVSRVHTAGGRQPCRVIGSAHDSGLCRMAPVVDSGRRTRLDSPVSMSGAEVLIAADDPRSGS